MPSTPTPYPRSHQPPSAYLQHTNKSDSTTLRRPQCTTNQYYPYDQRHTIFVVDCLLLGFPIFLCQHLAKTAARRVDSNGIDDGDRAKHDRTHSRQHRDGGHNNSSNIDECVWRASRKMWVGRRTRTNEAVSNGRGAEAVKTPLYAKQQRRWACVKLLRGLWAKARVNKRYALAGWRVPHTSDRSAIPTA